MGITATAAAYEEEIDGASRRLLLRNGEIERFEAQHAPVGIYEVFDGLMGRGRMPGVTQVRDIVALGLVGGGMSDRAAEDLVTGLGPDHNMALLAIAKRLLGVTFFPEVRRGEGKKKGAGSRKRRATGQPTTTPAPESETSAE